MKRRGRTNRACLPEGLSVAELGLSFWLRSHSRPVRTLLFVRNAGNPLRFAGRCQALEDISMMLSFWPFMLEGHRVTEGVTGSGAFGVAAVVRCRRDQTDCRRWRPPLDQAAVAGRVVTVVGQDRGFRVNLVLQTANV